MTSIRTLLLTLAVIALAGAAFGQSVYFEEGRGGFQAAASFSINEDLHGFAVTFGGCSNGNVDAQLSIGRFSDDYTTVTAFGFGLGLYPVKSRPQSPVGLGFVAGFEHDNASGSAWWSSYANATTVSFGAILYFKADDPPKSSIIPFVGVRYLSVIDGAVDGGGIFDAGLSFSLRTSGTNFLTITPQIAAGQETVTFTFELGLAVQSGPNQP